MKPADLLLAPELDQEQVRAFLRRYGFSDPDSADRNLQSMADDLATREILARIIGNVLEVARQSPDPDAAINHLERFLAVVPHPFNFLGFLADTPEALEALILICGTSPFTSEILIRNSEYFYELLDQLGTPWTKSSQLYQKEARQALSKFTDPTLQLHALARFKRREILRIGVRDILKLADVVATVTELSNLADTVVQLVYEITYARLVERYGTPQYRDARGEWHTALFTVLGMGKLGGGELNYSSDIDLIYLYNGEEGNTHCAPPGAQAGESDPQGEARGISNPEFFAKLAQSITQELSMLTEEGYFYRVDLRLRPEGSAGNVASSLTACKNYYPAWGETFERLALIKARPIAGSLELGQQFCDTFSSWVYRKFLDFASLDEIQEIKMRIETKLGSRQRKEAHVKLGAGGIREIEFFIQALQLIYGGQHPELQERSTLKALDRLLAHQFLTEREYQELREAYLFLRDLEHKLQMVFHLQTHELPASPEDLLKCARRMGFSGPSAENILEQFRKTYQTHTSNVSRIFQNLITLHRERISGGPQREAVLILNKSLPETEAFGILTHYGFEDVRSAFHHIVLLRDAPSFAHSPSKMRNLLANLLPSLLQALQTSPDPDSGLAHFEEFTKALGDRDSLYTLLNESPDILSRLMKILSASPFLAESLCRRPEFFDSLIRLDPPRKRKTVREFQAEIQRDLLHAGSQEAQRAALRDFQQREYLRIGMKDILGRLSRSQAGEQLAALAEACLAAAFQMASQDLEAHYGPGFSAWVQEHFAILALGKLGGGDLSYGSDLDLVFFYRAEDLSKSAEMQLRCVRLVEALDEILSVSHGEGSIYRIDTRLRPEGKKGELVVAMHRYREYLERRAANWERLALVRHRLIQGSRTVRRSLKNWIESFVYRSAWEPAVTADLTHIRRRMELELAKEAEGQRFHFKAGAGGLLDVEFATQLLQMKYGAHFPSLRLPNTTKALNKLVELQLLPTEQFNALSEGCEFLRLLENRLRIASPHGVAHLARTPAALGKMARLLSGSSLGEFASPSDLEAAYLAKTQDVRRAFRTVLAALQ